MSARTFARAALAAAATLALAAPAARAELRGPEAYAPWLGPRVLDSARAYTHPLPGGGTHTYWSWGVDLLGASALWDQGFTGEGVVVGIVDTGVDYDHPYLAGRVLWGRGLCSYTSSYDDDNGHGTHVAGIVRQMAPDVRFYAVKALDAGGSGGGCGANIEEAVRVAARGPDGALGTADDADVVSVSIGQIVPVGTAFAATFGDSIAATVAAGTPVVAAAGNSFLTPGTDSPGAYPSVISVAALGSYTGDRTLVAEYSSNGITDGDDTTKGLGEVEVLAPGTDVVSTFPGGGLATSSGTSMATPHVSGLLALLEEAQPGAASAAMRSRLRCSARDQVFSGKLSAPGYDLSTGHGLPDATRLLAGPCHGAATPQEIADEAVERGLDPSRDYDGDGIPDRADHLNTQAEVLARAGACDYLEIEAIGIGDEVTLVAPDGRQITLVAPIGVLQPFRLYFDGRLEGVPSQGALGPRVAGSLVGAAADGTWTLRPSALFAAIGETTAIQVAGKRFTMIGWCCAGPIAWTPVAWNWHTSAAETTYTGSLSVPGGTIEMSPLYARSYLPA